MAGILEFLGAGVFHKSCHVNEDSIRWQNGLVSKLHTATGTLLGLFTCTVFAKELLRDHIHCINVQEDTHVSEETFNSYCYISSTFTLPNKRKEEVQAYPGVGPVQRDVNAVYTSYYQWVPYLLFLQAISFYLPYTLYKFSQDGKITKLIQDLQNVIPFTEHREDKIGDIHLYLQDFYGSHDWWAKKLILSDFFNLTNIILNILTMNWYLGGRFISYGPAVIQHHMNGVDATSPFDLIFPKMTKCTLEMYGPSGSIVNHDGLCVLPINVLNEKVFLIMWLILVPLFFLTMFEQLFWLILVSGKTLRNRFLTNFVLSTASGSRTRLMNLLEKLSLGDWMVLYLVARNIDRALFTCLVEKIQGPGVGYFPEDDDDEEERL